jgi:hypothetical protein
MIDCSHQNTTASVCPVKMSCRQLTDCVTCASNPSCGWQASQNSTGLLFFVFRSVRMMFEGHCIEKSPSVPTIGNPTLCNSGCLFAATCQECGEISSMSCSWTQPLGTPSLELCTAQNMGVQSKCNPSCGFATDCRSCHASECRWCESSQRCFPIGTHAATLSLGQCTALVSPDDQQLCPADCARLTSCRECLRSARLLLVNMCCVVHYVAVAAGARRPMAWESALLEPARGHRRVCVPAIELSGDRRRC